MAKENVNTTLNNLVYEIVERPQQGQGGSGPTLVQVGSLSFVPRKDSFFQSADSSTVVNTETPKSSSKK